MWHYPAILTGVSRGIPTDSWRGTAHGHMDGNRNRSGVRRTAGRHSAGRLRAPIRGPRRGLVRVDARGKGPHRPVLVPSGADRPDGSRRRVPPAPGTRAPSADRSRRLVGAGPAQAGLVRLDGRRRARVRAPGAPHPRRVGRCRRLDPMAANGHDVGRRSARALV